MKKISLFILVLFSLFPGLAKAQLGFEAILPGPDSDRTTWGWETLGQIIGNIASLALILAAGVAIIYIIIGGYQYALSFGNPEAIEKAKGTITWAIIGLVVALASVLIIQYVVNFVTDDTGRPEQLEIPEMTAPQAPDPPENENSTDSGDGEEEEESEEENENDEDSGEEDEEESNGE
jgi:hypothetical protein